MPTTNNPYPHIPAPPGAAHVDAWEPYRTFIGQMRIIDRDCDDGAIEVYVNTAPSSAGSR